MGRLRSKSLKLEKGNELTESRNGPGVDSEYGRKLAKRFDKELFTKLEGISPGVTRVLQ